MIDIATTRSVADSGTPAREFDTRSAMPTILFVVVWALVLFTFSMPDRADGVGTIDIISKLKLAARGVSLLILSVMLLRQFGSLRGSAVMKTLLPFGLFVIWGMVSVAWSPLKSVSAGQIGSFAVLVLLAANIATYWKSNACTSQVFFQLSLVLLFFNVGLVAVRFLFADLGSAIRSEDALVHSTMAGANASLGIILLFGARMVWGWRWSRVLLLPGVAVHATQLYLAHSRTAMAATILACTLLYVVFVNRQLIWAGLLLACCAAGVYLAFDPAFELMGSVVSSGTEYAERDEHSSISNFSGRSEMWEVVWQSFMTSPLIGHGYFVSSATGELLVWYEYGNWTAHNGALQVLVSTGLIGGLLMLWGLGRPARIMLASLRQGTETNRLIHFLLVLATWFFVWGTMNETFVGPLQPESVVFFAMLGLGIGGALSVLQSANNKSPAAATSYVTLPTRQETGGLGPA